MAYVFEAAYGNNAGNTNSPLAVDTTGTIAGNLLVLLCSAGRTNGTLTGATAYEDGTTNQWSDTEVANIGAGTGIWEIFGYREATGTDSVEFDVQGTGSPFWAPAALVLEFSGLDSVPVEDSDFEATNVGTLANSTGSGTATPITANGVVVSMLGVPARQNWTATGDPSDIDETLGLSNVTSGTSAANGIDAIGGDVPYGPAVAKTNTWTARSGFTSFCFGGILVAHEAGVAGPEAGLSGSATLGIDGNDIRLGGKQIVITLTNDTWVSGASFDAQRQAIINGLDAATTPTNGWNNEVRDNLPVTSVVRVNDTVANVNLNAQPGYNVLAQEVITSTIPAAALVTSASDLTATPTFTVDPGDKGPATPDTFNEVTPQDTQLSASVGTVTDPDGLAAIPFNVTGPNEPDNGTLTNFNNTTGDYLYDPNPSYVGPDQFIVTVTDLKGFTSSVTVNIDVQAAASAAVEGTVVPTANESEIVTGGEVIDIRLTGDEWVAAGPTFDAVRDDIIAGLNSDGVELTGWNNEVRDKEVVTAVNRASNTLVRITLSPSAAYAIDNSETITVTVPAVALVTTTTDFDASPTFSIIPEAVSGVAPGGLQGPGQQVMPNAVTRLGGVVDE